MSRAISSRERRLVAVLILTALLALCWFVAIAPIIAGFAARAQAREALALRYAHNVRTISTIPRLRRRAEAERAALAPYVLPVRATEQGREWLKSRLQQVIAQPGGEMREATDAEAPDGWAAARATARLSVPHLVGILRRLDSEPPWLVVRSVTIGTNDPALARSGLNVQVDVAIPIRAAVAR